MILLFYKHRCQVTKKSVQKSHLAMLRLRFPKSHQGRKVPSLNRNPNGTAVSFLGAYFPMGTTSRYDFLLCRNRGALIYPFVNVHVKCCKKLTKKTHPFRSNHQFQPPKHHASLCQIAISQITQEYNVEHFFLQKELSSSFI